MAIASMIIGILSGIGLLGWGLLGYEAGRLGGAIGVAGSGALEFVSIVAPIAVLVGAGIVLKKHLAGGITMLAGGGSILLVIGFNAIGGHLAIPSIIAGGLGIWAEYSEENNGGLVSPSTANTQFGGSPLMSLPDDVGGSMSPGQRGVVAVPVTTARGEPLSEEAAMAIERARAAGHIVEFGAGDVVAFVSEGGSRHFCRSNADIVRAGKLASKMD